MPVGGYKGACTLYGEDHHMGEGTKEEHHMEDCMEEHHIYDL